MVLGLNARHKPGTWLISIDVHSVIQQTSLGANYTPLHAGLWIWILKANKAQPYPQGALSLLSRNTTTEQVISALVGEAQEAVGSIQQGLLDPGKTREGSLEEATSKLEGSVEVSQWREGFLEEGTAEAVWSIEEAWFILETKHLG